MNPRCHHLVSALRQDKQTPHPLLNRKQYLSDKLVSGDCLYARTIQGHYSCINAINFSQKEQEYLISGGDDLRVLVWRVSQLLNGDNKYVAMITNHDSNIFSLVTSCDDSYIYSSGNDGQIIKHDLNTGSSVNTYHNTAPVYCVDCFPTSPHVFAAATEDGSIFITDSREEKLSQDMILDELITSNQSVSINPCDQNLLVVGNESIGGALYDLRNWKKVHQYNPSLCSYMKTNSTSVSFNSTGSRVFIMYQSCPPMIFSTLSSTPLYICEDDTLCYRNKVTMKSGCFAEVDGREFVVSGSDDFRIYWWQLPLNDRRESGIQEVCPHLVVPGHRSIVNQTCYSDINGILCSSGVEKSMKLWTPFPQYSQHEPFRSLAPPSREHYHTVPSDSENNEETTQENEGVLAFFDALIEQENNDSDSDSSTDSEEEQGPPVYLSYHFLRNHDNRFNRHSSDDEYGIPSDSNSDHTSLSMSSGNTSSLIPPWSSEEEVKEEMKEEVEKEENTSQGSSLSKEYKDDIEFLQSHFNVTSNQSLDLKSNQKSSDESSD